MTDRERRTAQIRARAKAMGIIGPKLVEYRSDLDAQGRRHWYDGTTGREVRFSDLPVDIRNAELASGGGGVRFAMLDYGAEVVAAPMPERAG